MKKTNRRPPIIFCIGIILACLTLVSVHMTSGLYAKYTLTVSESDSARVAKFDLSAEDDFIVDMPISMKPGDSVEYSFDFANNGETTLKYTVKMTNVTGNLPLSFTGAEGTLLCGESMSDVTCTIAWDSQKSSVANMGKVDIVLLYVEVSQVD